jgi:hypothetical protein
VRGVFLAAAIAVLAQAVDSWREPGLTVISSGSGNYQPLAQGIPLALPARLPSDPQGVLVLFGLVQGMRF